MASKSFEPFLRKIQQLNQEGAYSQAIDLIDREAVHFPTQRTYLRFWQINLAAQFNPTWAMEMLNTALQEGLWFSEMVLRRSPALQRFRGDREFEQLISASRRVQEQAEAEEPSLLVLEPGQGCAGAGPDCPLLLALHANLSHPQACLDFWRPAVAAGWLLAMPRAPQAFWKGAYVWENPQKARGEVQDRLAELRIRYLTDPGRIILAGREQGGHLAMGLVLSGEVEAQGFILAHPQLPELQNWVPADIARQEQPLRGYIILGESELQTSHEPLLDLLKTLNAHNIPFELELRANPEGGSASASADLGHGLRYILGE